MTTKTHPLTPSEREELVDFGIRLGQACWDVYCQSPVGFTRLLMLPNDNTRRRANELFHLGFCGRLFMCPSDDTDSDGEMLWNDYLATMHGKIVLGYTAYPDMPEFVLGYAKHFFLEGFQAGTITVNEIFKL